MTAIQIKLSDDKWVIFGAMKPDTGELMFIIHGVSMLFKSPKEAWDYWQATHDEHGTDTSSWVKYAESH